MAGRRSTARKPGKNEKLRRIAEPQVSLDDGRFEVVPFIRRQKVDVRKCLVLSPCVAGGTDRKIGEIIDFDGEEVPGVIRSLTDRELEAMATRAEVPDEIAPEIGSEAHFEREARKGLLTDVIMSLDLDVDDHWTETGDPNPTVVGGLLVQRGIEESETTLAELRAIVPELNRETLMAGPPGGDGGDGGEQE